MSFADLLIDVCTIKRFNDTGTDDYGRPTGTWDDHLPNKDCRLQSVTNKEVVIGAEVVIADYKLFINDLDITEQDRIVIDSITYEILSVAVRKDSSSAHHKELLMRTVR